MNAETITNLAHQITAKIETEKQLRPHTIDDAITALELTLMAFK